MSNIEVKIEKIHPDARTPTYASSGAAGCDLYSVIRKVLWPGDIDLLPTGLKMEIPFGYEGQIRPRSGLALKHGLIIPNSPGTIDSDYRGEVRIILLNSSQNKYIIEAGDRIAQMVLQKVEKANFMESYLSLTERGEGGFGHSGKR